MALKQLSFSKSWTNPADFPTVETDETVIRQDMQQLHDETKDYLNRQLLPGIEAGYAPAERRVNGHPLTADVTVTKGDVGLGAVDNTADLEKPVSRAQAAAIQAVAMGQIPAGSVTQAMLAGDVAAAVDRAEAGGALDGAIAGKVSKAGDTMTGNLQIQSGPNAQVVLKNTADGAGTVLLNSNHRTALQSTNVIGDGTNYRAIFIHDSAVSGPVNSAVQLVDKVNNVSVFYKLYGEHNRPTAADIPGAAQVKTVEYTGTGTKSVSVALGFAPRIVAVQQLSEESSDYCPLVMAGTGTVLGLFRSGSGGDLSGFSVKATEFGSTVSWTASAAGEAYNAKNGAYRVVAIG